MVVTYEMATVAARFIRLDHPQVLSGAILYAALHEAQATLQHEQPPVLPNDGLNRRFTQ